MPHNGLRLSGIRAHHVLAFIEWPGANGHSKRVLGRNPESALLFGGGELGGYDAPNTVVLDPDVDNPGVEDA